MAIPKVKISFDADFDELKKGVKGASTEVQGFGDKMGDYSKKVGAAFAVAGAAAAAYAGKLLIDGVKSAIEDEAAQSKLAATLTNVANATGVQIAQTEAYILKASLATGKTDNELRPSFERLARATGNISEAMKLQQLALDASAGSGKSLEAVTEALSKSYEGSNTALGKLGLGISKTELKSMSFEDVQKKLAQTFEGQSSKQADTFAGKMSRLSVAFDEGKETVGAFILDAITPLVSSFVNDIIPKISEVANKIIPALKDGFNIFVGFYKSTLAPVFDGIRGAFSTIGDAIEDNKDKILPFINMLKALVGFVVHNVAPVIGEVLGGAFKVVGNIIAGAIKLIAGAMDVVVDLVNGVITIINFAIRAYNALPLGKDINEIGKLGGAPIYTSGGAKSMGGGSGSAASSGAISVDVTGGGTSGGTTSKASGKGSALVITAPSINSSDYAQRNAGVVNNINVTGAIDPESTARQIVEILNSSYYRGTGGASSLQMV